MCTQYRWKDCILIALAGALLVFTGACRPASKAPGEAASSSAISSAAPGAAPTSQSTLTPLSRAPDPQSPRLRDPLWLAARGEDDLERQRLAEAVGATGLLLGLEEGGEPARTALLSLPYTDDADHALARLGELSLIENGSGLSLLLESVLAIAKRPQDAREPWDPEGTRACAQAMLTLAKRSSLPQPDRALAISAARAFAEKGLLDTADVPSDLDPP